MKQYLLFLFVLTLLSGCGSKDAKQALANKPVSNDQVIQEAILDFLMGDADAVRFTEKAKQDLAESTWPEVQCSVDGTLDSPSSFKNLTVKRVGPGLFKYECTCPEHDDRYVDCCTISASVASDGTIQIDAVTWDDATEFSGDLLDDASWVDTEYGFKVPDFMTYSPEIFVEDVPATVHRWDCGDVCLSCWPLLGNWSVDIYPEKDSYLTDEVKVKTITYRNGDDSVFSGYADDGRIWYMKKNLLREDMVVHSKVLVLIYPKSKQPDVEKLIDEVKRWK